MITSIGDTSIIHPKHTPHFELLPRSRHRKSAPVLWHMAVRKPGNKNRARGVIAES